MITHMKKKDAIPSPKNACSNEAMCAVSCLFADTQQVHVTCICQLFESHKFGHVFLSLLPKDMVVAHLKRQLAADDKGNTVLCKLSLV